MKLWRVLLLTIFVLSAFGCASKEEKLKGQLDLTYSQVAKNVKQLEIHLEKGRIKNAEILKSYANYISTQYPEKAEIASVLKEDGGTEGALFSSIKDRMQEVKNQIPEAARSAASAGDLNNELLSINQAVSIDSYNSALSDPINVLAEMSNGKLSKVNALDENEQTNNSSSDAGSALVGNPNYGQWQSDSSGNTFWEWYGKYALFSNIVDMLSYGRYNSWSENRKPSYYHDFGREYYSSPKQKTDYKNTETRVKKQFSQQGKKFQSPYANKKATKPSNKNNSVFKVPDKFKSHYVSSSKNTNNTSNSKNNKNPAYNSRSNKFNSRSFGFGGK